MSIAQLSIILNVKHVLIFLESVIFYFCHFFHLVDVLIFIFMLYVCVLSVTACVILSLFFVLYVLCFHAVCIILYVLMLLLCMSAYLWFEHLTTYVKCLW